MPHQQSLSDVAVGQRRAQLSVVLGRTAGRASQLLGRGSGGNVAGRVARTIDADALRRASRQRQVLLVSGTNGKTTTTCFLAAATALAGSVATNAQGNNLLDGLASTVISREGRRADRLVLEVDEAVLPAAAEQLAPSVVVLLNLTRDQLDRYGEVSGHVRRWAAMLAANPGTTCVANADDILVTAAVLSGRPSSENVVWVAGGSAWHADSTLCPVCGTHLEVAVHYRCGACGFGRPEVTWDQVDGGVQTPDGAVLEARLGLPGQGNRGNAVMALAAAHTAGVAPRDGLAAIATIRDVQGRYSRAEKAGRSVELRLAKNPAGWVDTLDALGDDHSHALVLAINARGADGLDPSWLWDVPFERLQGRTVAVTGERRRDLAVRLDYADVPYVVGSDFDDALAKLPADPTVVIANYTAFQQARTWVGGAR